MFEIGAMIFAAYLIRKFIWLSKAAFQGKDEKASFYAQKKSSGWLSWVLLCLSALMMYIGR